LKLLVVVVNDPVRVEDVLAALFELDVTGMIVLESETAMHLLATEVPLFAGLRHLVQSPRSHNRCVFSLTEDPEVLRKLDRMLKEIGFDIAAPGAGYALLLDAEGFIGGREE